MTEKASFTDDEWSDLLWAPVMAGMAVAAASPSGFLGSMREAFAGKQALAEERARTGRNALIDAILADLETAEGRARVQLTELGPLSSEQLRARAIDICRRAAACAAAKASRDEAQGFARWLSTIGHRVAVAWREGGFLGIGGVAITEAEREAMDALDGALGLEDEGSGVSPR